ncbi:angiopoietin-related protein 1-like [Armigeres subalbatus]|uniref:angiopoietin-related protein 1-like n=1 Tax=Armigeres subalbatus TaxID=124917 RepID=UPI002ED56FB6
MGFIWIFLLLVLSRSTILCKDESNQTCGNGVGFGLELILAKLESLELEILSLKDQNRNLTDFISRVLTKNDKSYEQVANSSFRSTSEVEIDETNVYSSCSMVSKGKSGMYLIRATEDSDPIRAYCEMELYGGGWTVIQKRTNGSENFYRNWTEYKAGFGSLDGEFWFGLHWINLLTSAKTHEIMFHLMDFNRKIKHARYNPFRIGNESTSYKIEALGVYTGTAGDSFKQHLGKKFSTFDVDNDSFGKNCAMEYYGAWWYHACYNSNLNGKYTNTRVSQAMCWNTFNQPNEGLMSSTIMIRPV